MDNIMTAELKDEARLGQWRAQSVFASRLVSFAQRFDVHVHLVAHPGKPETEILRRMTLPVRRISQTAPAMYSGWAGFRTKRWRSWAVPLVYGF